jgi:hypothetical protein
MKNKRVGIVFIFIVLIYWSTHQGNEGTNYLNKLDFALKPFLVYIFFALVAFMGYYGLSETVEQWIKKIWIITYAATSVIIILSIIIRKAIGIEDRSLAEMSNNLRLFFTSPVPFAVLLYLNRKFVDRRNKNSTAP